MKETKEIRMFNFEVRAENDDENGSMLSGLLYTMSGRIWDGMTRLSMMARWIIRI